MMSYCGDSLRFAMSLQSMRSLRDVIITRTKWLCALLLDQQIVYYEKLMFFVGALALRGSYVLQACFIDFICLYLYIRYNTKNFSSRDYPVVLIHLGCFSFLRLFCLICEITECQTFGEISRNPPHNLYMRNFCLIFIYKVFQKI